MQDSNINTAIDNRRVYNLVAYFFFLNVSLNPTLPNIDALSGAFLTLRIQYELTQTQYNITHIIWV